MDQILIRDLELFAYHGVNPEEKEMGQSFLLDITAFLDLAMAGQSDDLQDTVSYAAVIKETRKLFCAETYHLLEAAAQHVLAGLFKAFPSICRIRLRLKKPDAPIQAKFSYVAIEIERERIR